MYPSSSFHHVHPATEQYLLEVCGPTISHTPPLRSQRATHRTSNSNGRTRRSSLAIRDIPPPVSFPVATRLIASVLPMRKIRCRFVARPLPIQYGIRWRSCGWLLEPRFVEWCLSLTCVPPCRIFLFLLFGFWIDQSFLPLSHLTLPYHLVCHFLQLSFAFLCYPPYILSSALPLHTHQCCSVTRIRYFINYGTSLLFSTHVPNLLFHC